MSAIQVPVRVPAAFLARAGARAPDALTDIALTHLALAGLDALADPLFPST